MKNNRNLYSFGQGPLRVKRVDLKQGGFGGLNGLTSTNSQKGAEVCQTEVQRRLKVLVFSSAKGVRVCKRSLPKIYFWSTHTHQHPYTYTHSHPKSYVSGGGHLCALSTADRSGDAEVLTLQKRAFSGHGFASKDQYVTAHGSDACRCFVFWLKTGAENATFTEGRVPFAWPV